MHYITPCLAEESYQSFSLKTSTSCRYLEKIFHQCHWDATPSNHETLWKEHTSSNKRQSHSIYHFIYLLVHTDTSSDRVESRKRGALPAGHHRRPQGLHFCSTYRSQIKNFATRTQSFSLFCQINLALWFIGWNLERSFRKLPDRQDWQNVLCHNESFFFFFFVSW